MQHDRETYILEPHPLTFELRLLCKKDDELVIFDVGSCEGEDSVRFSRLFPRSKIFAFEPIPDNFTLLEENSSCMIFLMLMHLTLPYQMVCLN